MRGDGCKAKCSCLYMLNSVSHLSHAAVKQNKTYVGFYLGAAHLKPLSSFAACGAQKPSQFLWMQRSLVCCVLSQYADWHKHHLWPNKIPGAFLTPECFTTLKQLWCKITGQEPLEQVVSTVQVGIQFSLPLPHVLSFCHWVFYYPMTSHRDMKLLWKLLCLCIKT